MQVRAANSEINIQKCSPEQKNISFTAPATGLIELLKVKPLSQKALNATSVIPAKAHRYAGGMMFLQSFSPNVNGDDFVIGDLHGMYDLLFKTLASVHFDFYKDRCFSVGDLIDRGPDSEKCLGLITEPWFHPVCGNHEDSLRNVAHNPESSSILANWILNGGHWHLKVSTAKMLNYAALVDTLPYLIEVETTTGHCIAICHAEFPLNRYEPEAVKNDEDLIKNMMWSRTKIQAKDKTVISGIDKVFCGHTIVDDVVVLGNTYFIDTGAFQSDKLTLLPLNKA